MGFLIELFEGPLLFIQASWGLLPIMLWILLVGGFLFFLLSKFWWKPLQEKKAAEAAATADKTEEIEPEKPLKPEPASAPAHAGPAKKKK